MSVNAVEMLIFGGTQDKVYTFNIKSGDDSGLKANSQKISEKSEFCGNGELFARVYQNQYIYATDTKGMNLHCCVLDDFSWDL